MDTTIGREGEVASITSSLIGGRSVLLVGEAGVGKSHLAAAVAKSVASQGWTVEWIIGSPSIRSVRFGAVQHLVGNRPTSAQQLPAVAAERHLRAIDRDRPVLLAIDDIDGIDEGSGAVVQSLALAGIVVMATVRDDGAGGRGILGMWKDQLLERVDVHALDATHTTALSAAFLGGPLDATTVDAVARLTLGNPLFVREVLADARSVGSLIERDGVWTLTDRLSAHDRVSDLLADRFEHLAPDEREALELVAVGEPMPVAVLERATSAQHLEALARTGLVSLARVGAIDVVRASHPLVGELIRSMATDIGSRRLAGVLATAILADPEPRSADLVRAVSWLLDAGALPPPDAAIAAAGVALTTFDGSQTRRFVDASGVTDSSSLVLLGRAHLLENDPKQALDALTEAESVATDDAQRAVASAARAEVLLFALGDGESADLVLEAAWEEIGEPDACAILAGEMMLSAGLRGDFGPALGLWGSRCWPTDTSTMCHA